MANDSQKDSEDDNAPNGGGAPHESVPSYAVVEEVKTEVRSMASTEQAITDPRDNQTEFGLGFPLSVDANAIRDFVNERGITRIVHFTPFPGLVGILSLGKVLSRRAMESFSYTNPDSKFVSLFGYNDPERHDMKLNCINMSIEHINADLFWAFKERDHCKEPWCILEFDPGCLQTKGTRFSISNAASRFVRDYGTGTGIDSLKTLFYKDIHQATFLPERMLSAFIPELKRRYQKLALERPDGFPDNWTTDEQAEVLIPNELSVEHLRGIVFRSEEDKRNALARLDRGDLPGLNQLRDKFKVNHYDFESRGVALRSIWIAAARRHKAEVEGQTKSVSTSK